MPAINQQDFLRNPRTNVRAALFSGFGMFRCTAVQTQRSIVKRHVDNISHVPRPSGPDFQVMARVFSPGSPKGRIMVVGNNSMNQSDLSNWNFFQHMVKLSYTLRHGASLHIRSSANAYGHVSENLQANNLRNSFGLVDSLHLVNGI